MPALPAEQLDHITKKDTQLKEFVDASLAADNESVEHVVVLNRTGNDIERNSFGLSSLY